MTATLDARLAEITGRIRARSEATRRNYLDKIEAARGAGPGRAKLSCANWAHAFAGQAGTDKLAMRNPDACNIGIVTAYNDMLSAHKPFEDFPERIRAAARELGATAQVAGGVPAMCDGVTQGRPGMELSLFSRDVIALATSVALCHDAFDAALMLGVCDKIVPGLFIGALAFGHLPVIFVPAGPMDSGMPNAEKARIRALYAEGKVDRAALLEAETRSYHGPGTCTFYGTANSNQMLMEMMGLHMPGTAFIHPNTPLRHALTRAATQRAVSLAHSGEAPLAEVVNERTIVNGIVGLMATGGSTNHAIHLVAMARAAGVLIDWSDFSDISAITPLLARVYPNGGADVNAFQAAGGVGFVIRELLSAGLLHGDVLTVAGRGLEHYAQEPVLEGGTLVWRPVPEKSLDESILRPIANPFDTSGGLRLMTGGLGRAVVKVSAVAPEQRRVQAPAAVFESQEEFLAAFKAGKLDRDVVAVVRFQGPAANGMPELHSLTPALSVLQGRGHKVALITDGRMSGASGKVLSAIHVTPEAKAGGMLARLRNGDVILVDANAGVLEIAAASEALAAREAAKPPPAPPGFGREYFAGFRELANDAEAGASVLFS
ncbi:MAG: phosphogluconate dehydratase [Alphaproteobacteria bacterium]|nr:phosphogluconate dehydratase [Alphaproteobacteria bacterium]MDE2011823.1 phosphogluconate dehydratase [Alphaproteobacteria bacterium]MDE2072333.1 phosphogluconate dehydratase [Alphaproteobacteria bacterium]MDE2351460.1 phosphogluconate dehydratase [Alphaproteobacteria bacterium]